MTFANIASRRTIFIHAGNVDSIEHKYQTWATESIVKICHAIYMLVREIVVEKKINNEFFCNECDGRVERFQFVVLH